ncbi:hypothetical protein [Ideonella sp. YS5]|uniref:hypothetical protein n=1 Tax=Ideonella sp. YS5 TaxID=3453714 RepID=UPI003EEDE622
MRHTNKRVVFAGLGLLLFAVAFFIVMLSMAPRSTDPVELMRTVGGVSGALGGLAIAMMAIGMVRKKSA